jgi:hypothetical protein
VAIATSPAPTVVIIAGPIVVLIPVLIPVLLTLVASEAVLFPIGSAIARRSLIEPSTAALPAASLCASLIDALPEARRRLAWSLRSALATARLGPTMPSSSALPRSTTELIASGLSGPGPLSDRSLAALGSAGTLARGLSRAALRWPGARST